MFRVHFRTLTIPVYKSDQDKMSLKKYKPHKVVEFVRSSIISGIIARVRFRRRILLIFYQSKDIYYWLPYKKLIDQDKRYGIVGPNRRDPYAACWFEVKSDSELYKQGLNEFIFRHKKLYRAGNAVRIQIFTPKELVLLNRKSVTRFLDECFAFAIQSQNKHFKANKIIKNNKS